MLYLDDIYKQFDSKLYKQVRESKAMGMYLPNRDQIVLVLDRIRTPELLLLTLKHEFTHRGYNLLAKDPFTANILSSLAKSQFFRNVTQELSKKLQC